METAPDRISRYEIKGLIARGGMGRLYLARDPQNLRLVVLKLLDATLDSSDLRQRFEREAQALASLNHPSIVRIYDNGSFHDSPFIVMEYVRGETLEEKIKRQAPLTLVQKLSLLSQLCDGLAHAHRAGLVHRDIKPANLMVDQDDRLKILDFGIARVADSNLTRMRSGDQWIPLQIGTPGYMSPEQMQGTLVDPRTDVFAVGAVAYELFAYREAFPGSSTREIEAKVARTPPEAISARIPSFDPALDAMIARALARDREQRYPSAEALGEAFDGYRARLNPGQGAAPAKRQVPPAVLAGGSPAEVAYARAVIAYEEKAFDLARRYAIEALAEDPGHAGARTFVGGFQQAPMPAAIPRPARPAAVPPTASRTAAHMPQPPRRPDNGPEVVSTDPTVLISRADRATTSPPAAQGQYVEPTVVIKREELAKHLHTDETVVIRPSHQRPHEDTEPAPAPPPAARNRRQPPPAAAGPSLAASIGAFWTRLTARPVPPPAPPRRGAAAPRSAAAPARGSFLSNPATRGVLIGVAAFLVAGIVVLGAIGIVRTFWSSGQKLTITKPTGGTITGAGLECGTNGNDCSASFATGERVELEALADKGFIFSGFTGDCAPSGRMAMTAAHTCGANFAMIEAPPTQVLWPLTIVKPAGGSILAAGDIACGSVGDKCSANLPDGVPVTLHAEADTGYRFVSFTNECDASGNTTMSAPRTCGATFVQSAAPVNTTYTAPPRQTVETRPPVKTEISRNAPVEAPPPPVAVAPVQEAPALPVLPSKPAENPITPEEHAKRAIALAVRDYCAAHQTLKAESIEKLFPRVNKRVVDDQFRQYKSLRCALTDPIEYELLTVTDAAGAAQIKFGMKQTIEVKVGGGAPKVTETIVTMKLSRPRLRTDWVIDNVDHVVKPKP